MGCIKVYSFVSMSAFDSSSQKLNWSSGNGPFVRTKNERCGGIFDGDREEAADKFSIYRPFQGTSLL